MLTTTHLCRNFCSPQAVDIVDQLSTTFKICLCTTYIRNFLDYPSQLYWQRILRERQEQLKQARKPRSYASPKLRPTFSVTGVRCVSSIQPSESALPPGVGTDLERCCCRRFSCFVSHFLILKRLTCMQWRHIVLLQAGSSLPQVTVW